jgi:hypothetical protein
MTACGALPLIQVGISTPASKLKSALEKLLNKSEMGKFDRLKLLLYQFFMKLHRIRSPLAPLKKGGTGSFLKYPFLRGI